MAWSRAFFCFFSWHSAAWELRFGHRLALAFILPMRIFSVYMDKTEGWLFMGVKKWGRGRGRE